MTAFLNPWVILSLVLAIAGAFGGGYYKGNSAGQAEVQQKWDKEKTEQYAAYAEAQEAARTREQNLQIQADRLREDKDNEIRNLNARVAPPPLPVPCPVPPALAAPPSSVLEQDFLKRMESFLQGKLPEPTKPESSSSSATTNTTP
jgi:hypothetical protein